MPSRADKVEADMNPCVMAGGQLPFNFQLLLQVGFKLGVNVVHNRPEGLFFVHLVTVANCVNQGELEMISGNVMTESKFD